jgi:sigma-B regulation protein RsbU (phosphoserine phosphatase)
LSLIPPINAGHYPPILYNGKDIVTLKSGSSVIGAFEKLPFIKEAKVEINSGSFLFCFTDGLIDTKNESDQYYEDSMVIDFIKTNAHLNAKEFNEKILADLDKFKGSKSYVDDIALLTTKIK